MHKPSTTGTITPSTLLRVRIETIIAIAANPNVAGNTVAQLATTKPSAADEERSVPPTSINGSLPTGITPASVALAATVTTASVVSVNAAATLPQNTAVRSTERVKIGLQRPALILGREHVTGDQRRDQRQQPLRRIHQDRQRGRVAGVLEIPAIQRFQRQPILVQDQPDVHPRRHQEKAEHRAHTSLREQLAQLDPVDRRRHAHATTSSATGASVSVSRKNNVSSAVVGSSSWRMPTPRAPTSSVSRSTGPGCESNRTPSGRRVTRCTPSTRSATSAASASSPVTKWYSTSSARARSSCIEPSNASRPRRMIATCRQISSTSSMLWLDSKIVIPPSASRRTSARISRIPAGSSPLVGSSSTSRRGERINAAAPPSRCTIP